MKSIEQQQYEAFLAKLSQAERRKRRQRKRQRKSRPYLLAFVKKQKQVARSARYVLSRSLPHHMRVDVNQEWGHHFILLETLFDYPEEAWGDPGAMREHRRNPVWILVRSRLAKVFRKRKINQALANRLTDFAFPETWIELANKLEIKERLQLDQRTKKRNAELRWLAAQEKRAQQSENAKALQLVESLWPREVKEIWAGHCWYGERLQLLPLSYARPGENRKRGRPHRPLVLALRRASLRELTKGNFTREKASYVIDEIETALRISRPLAIGYGNYGKPRRVDAVLKSQ